MQQEPDLVDLWTIWPVDWSSTLHERIAVCRATTRQASRACTSFSTATTEQCVSSLQAQIDRDANHFVHPNTRRRKLKQKQSELAERGRGRTSNMLSYGLATSTSAHTRLVTIIACKSIILSMVRIEQFEIPRIS